MILAVDIGGDRKSYGFQLVLNSITQRFGQIVDYCSNDNLGNVDMSSYYVILFSFMFVENYIHFIPTMKKLGLNYYPEGRKQIIIAGGSPISENPEPIAEFLDICVIGEGEWAIIDILEILFRHKCKRDTALQDVYDSIDCAYVPKFYNPTYDSNERVSSCEGRRVQIRREDPNKAFQIPAFYTRRGRGASRLKEYAIEYHRGCKRRCRFCSFSYLQAPYREVDKTLLFPEIERIALYDRHAGNKIVMLQTNLFHMDYQTLSLLKFHNKMPDYSSACLADMFDPKNKEILSFLSGHHKHIFLRFGIEDFTEEGRRLGGKPIPDEYLLNLPYFLDNRGRHLKFFFISSLPWQTVGGIQHFEAIMDKMAQKLHNYIFIECYTTTLNYKLSAGLLNYPKIYMNDVQEYLAYKFKTVYGGGKLKLKIYKNADELSFYEINFLSLGNRKIGKILIDLCDNYSRRSFVDACGKGVDVSGLLLPYTTCERLPNWFIDYGQPIRAAGGIE